MAVFCPPLRALLKSVSLFYALSFLSYSSLAASPIAFPGLLKCEESFSDGDKIRNKLARGIFSNNESWKHFMVSNKITPSALSFIGLNAANITEFQYIFVERRNEDDDSSMEGPPKLISVIDIVAIDDNIQRRQLLELKLYKKQAVEWVSVNKTPTFDLGYIWPRGQNARIYFSATGSTETGEIDDSVSDEEWEALDGVKFTLGLDIECPRIHEYSTTTDVERIRTPQGVRCRVPILRFRGFKPSGLGSRLTSD